MHSSSSTALVWFRRDLRVTDNPALSAAARRHARVIPVYIHHRDIDAAWDIGEASRWWLHQSLKALGAQFEASALDLQLAHGDPAVVLQHLCAATGASAVYWNRSYEPSSTLIDKQVSTLLRNAGVAVNTYSANLLFEPWDIERKDGGAYRVFTPYYRTCLQHGVPSPDSSFFQARQIGTAQKNHDVDKLGLRPKNRWWSKFESVWSPGESSAQAALQDFIDDKVNAYPEKRGTLAESATSRLSAHLHFGEISPRTVWHELEAACLDPSEHTINRAAIDAFQRQLIWRDFAHHLLYHFPNCQTQPLNTLYADFPWENNSEFLHAWQRGETGIPMVDAGMRELWQTGIMHNRARMICASFLTKNLNIGWLSGARWFWDTLVDADLANNIFGWQWAAGCGADAAPYFRVFNPARQGERFDSEGHYVRRWLPEIAKLNSRYIHQPWEAPRSELQQAGIALGENYPLPIVDLSQSRQAAIERYHHWREYSRTHTQGAA